MPNTPVTHKEFDEVLAASQEQTARSLKRYARSATVGFLILLAANAYVWSYSNRNNNQSRDAIVRSGKAVSISGCNRDFRSTQALRGVLKTADQLQARAIKTGEITISPKQRQIAHKFYSQQLRNLPLPDCKAAGEVLTNDPDAKPLVPRPLAPKK